MPAPATLLEVEVAAPSHPRHLGPAAIQIRPDSTPRFRGPIQPRGRIPLGANLLRALDAMIPAAVAPAEMRTLAALALDCLTVPTELLPFPALSHSRGARPCPRHRQTSPRESPGRLLGLSSRYLFNGSSNGPQHHMSALATEGEAPLDLPA